MSTDQDMRLERINRLLRELQYEVTRGVMEHDIDPEIGFTFQMPYKDDLVFGEFRTRIMKPRDTPPICPEPRLRSVKDE